MTAPNTPDEPPARFPWPPVLLVATVGFGLLLDGLAPLPLATNLKSVGSAIIVLALLNEIWCALELRRHHTTILPYRSVSTLVTTGPYRWSRNPIYVSHVALAAGVGMVLGSLWTLLLTPALILALMRLSIMPEEEHLAKKFGPAFGAYVKRTKRWV
jgi:protein-S-isoprenylcysteine O-methyltransferase Ste14